MREHEEHRVCDAEFVTLTLLPSTAEGDLRGTLDRLIERDRRLENGEDCGVHPIERVALRKIIEQVQTVFLPTCSYAGQVQVMYHLDTSRWECPLCGAQHFEDGLL